MKNPVAKTLSDPKFKPKVVKPKKGKGAYVRKDHAILIKNKIAYEQWLADALVADSISQEVDDYWNDVNKEKL